MSGLHPICRGLAMTAVLTYDEFHFSRDSRLLFNLLKYYVLCVVISDLVWLCSLMNCLFSVCKIKLTSSLFW